MGGIVCDLDGVVYRGDEPVEGSPAAIEALRGAGMRVLFCTNNAGPTLGEYVAKLEGMGIRCEEEDLVTSSVVAAEVVAAERPSARAVVVGGPGLHEALQQRGISETDGDADVVVVGRDTAFSYDDMARAATAVRAGASFYATNDDATYPDRSGELPGAGAIVAGIEVAAGTRARVLGKPHRPMMEAALRRLPQGVELAMVGDRPETDLDGARAMGWKTVLVLSGVTDAAAAARVSPQPDVIVDRLASLVRR